MIVKIADSVGDFAEDKDIAARLREIIIKPHVMSGGDVQLDFSSISLATQSFVHALVSDVLRTRGETALDQIEFQNCVPQVRRIIETVVQYSLETANDPSDSLLALPVCVHG